MTILTLFSIVNYLINGLGNSLKACYLTLDVLKGRFGPRLYPRSFMCIGERSRDTSCLYAVPSSIPLFASFFFLSKASVSTFMKIVIRIPIAINPPESQMIISVFGLCIQPDSSTQLRIL